jgi:hypothetical protein
MIATSKFCLSLLVVLVVGPSSAAFAQNNTKPDRPPVSLTGSPEQRAACGPDVGKFCKTVKASEGAAAYISCLVENYDKLSAACRNVLDKETK